MSNDHCQAIADNIAIDKYGMFYGELPKDYQNLVWKQAVKLADKQIKELTR
jgi:hypothetical protein